MGPVKDQEKAAAEYRNGIIAIVGCSTLWGVLPIYWQAIKPIDSWVIIIYRIFLVCAVCLIAARTKYSWAEITGPLKDRKVMMRYFIAGVVITANWSTYIWAVNANRVIQTAIGYYIEPLMVCIFGIIFFREKLTKWKAIALISAMGSVVLILVHFGQLPGIALVIAITFATYSAIKKTMDAPPILSLLHETIFLAPLALIAIFYIEAKGIGAIGVGAPYKYVLLLLSGLMTAVPLGLFARAASRIPLFAIGLISYISPSISLALGVFWFKEPFDRVQLMAFAIIWIGLIFFTYGEYKEKDRNELIDGFDSFDC